MTSHLWGSPTIAGCYTKFRPKYPKVLYDEIIGFIKIPGSYSQAVDVGCGSGQFTTELSPHFAQVLGTDISQEQINHAKQNNKLQNVIFKVGNFDNIPLPDTSCELVTSFLAAHWFDPIQTFYDDADRVLKPGGCLAVGGYGLPKLSYGDASVDDDLNRCYDAFMQTVGKYSLKGNIAVEAHYKGWELIYEDSVRHDEMKISQSLTVSDFIGYLRSYSMYGTYLRQHPDEKDPTEIFKHSVSEVLAAKTTESVKLNATWDIFLLLGRKPSTL